MALDHHDILHLGGSLFGSGRSALNVRRVHADDGDVNTSTAVELSSLSGCALLCVAADPVRWRLLSALAAGELCVCELQPIARVTAPALSHHLKVLRAAGLVTAARRGRWIDYSLASDAADRLRAALPLAVAHAGCGSCHAAGSV
ncbi:ArsR/SmtB family transcription factor [Actinoplanes solisilvae]|uniref:ArsR/SmtB family transcription factor n=1 Tax=Actinoplanes solisilvae TaxID=2486853 RepID=UPI000FD72F61|nr:metalloregulator ArsR/SmtB family transcription factor [Actinoplanes solisilvae]